MGCGSIGRVEYILWLSGGDRLKNQRSLKGFLVYPRAKVSSSNGGDSVETIEVWDISYSRLVFDQPVNVQTCSSS